ncbi:MAG: dihydroorotase [Myxococcota bacterium]
MARLVLNDARILDPVEGTDAPGTVIVEGDRITGVALPGDGDVSPQPCDRVESLEGCWLVPGLVDLRCALREPGFEFKEDVHTGLRAAAAGGYTAVCTTPDTRPVTDREAVVRQILERSETAEGARLLPVGAATAGLGDQTLAPIGELKEAGCVAVSQGEHPLRSARLMRRLLEYAGGFGIPVFISPTEPTLEGLCDEGLASTRLGLPGSPAAAEAIGVSRDTLLAELTGQRLHLQRLSTADGLAALRAARERGVPVTCDVTGHHLSLTVEALEHYDPDARVRPPLRAAHHREALRQALAEGLIDAVVSDHQPHHAEDKAREFDAAATGVSAIETTASLVLMLVDEGVISPLRAVELLSAGPRAVLGIEATSVAAGARADLTVIDPRTTWIPDASTLRSRGRNTPFVGRVLRGRAVRTLVGGREIWRASDAEVT